jgi:outer membrane protein assembly factor BamB
MIRCDTRRSRIVHFALACCAVLAAGPLFAATTAEEILKSAGGQGGLIAVVGCGEATAPKVAADLGKGGDWLVHAVAGDAQELAQFHKAIAAADVQGCVSAEQLGLASLPYRDYLVNTLVIMDLEKAQAAGLNMEEVRRCVVPQGKIVICGNGKVAKIEQTPPCQDMDVWTHRYYDASGIPDSNDKVFDLPVGFKWNCGLPMNFDNPLRSANRYSSTRALVVDDGRCFTFSTAVYENLGPGWRSDYGTDQYLTCRDAFNGRMLWRKRIGDTYYGGLYIENMAPLVSTGRHLYLAGDNGKMLAVSTRTGETVRELPTANIPGVIAAADGTVVVATWKDGRVMGSIERYDRRRMDWDIDAGTIEAYDDASGELLWKNDLLGTSLVIADGIVFIVNRTEKDPLEKNHNRRREGDGIVHPPQQVIAIDLAKGSILWRTEAGAFEATDQALSLEAAGFGAVAVGLQGRSRVALLSAETGEPLSAGANAEAGKNFFRYRNHICTPVMRVGEVVLNNRGGTISKPGEQAKFGGARAACLTGTVPAYGAGYIAQNWCRCSPGQIPGLLAISPIGEIPPPEDMQTPTQPVVYGKYNDGTDGIAPASLWTSFRGNAQRSSSAACDIPDDVAVAWSQQVAGETQEGTVARDRRSYLNSRLTAAVVAGGLAIVGDIDHNEIIAVDVNDGSVQWRSMLGGRVDSAPTAYQGICLVGDHTGYVSAIKIKTGELIYKLRIAPDEKRMVSYGKVESVWPVIGGVMVADGKAYASAGRTQGSDGGLVVRAFAPETGQSLWSTALPQNGPNLVEKKPKRNDTLARHGDFLTVMGHWMNLKTGKISPPPKVQPPQRTVVMGLEGLYSWNWTRLGHRKFMHIGYGEFTGDTVSWNDKLVATTNKDSGGMIAALADPAKKRPFPGVPKVYQGTSLVLCNNVLIQGGAILDQDQEHGFIRAISLEDGQVVWEEIFDAKLAFNGLAVDTCGIIASFDDGTVVCLK